MKLIFDAHEMSTIFLKDSLGRIKWFNKAFDDEGLVFLL